MPPVRLEPIASQSRVKHSTAEPQFCLTFWQLTSVQNFRTSTILILCLSPLEAKIFNTSLSVLKYSKTFELPGLEFTKYLADFELSMLEFTKCQNSK